MYTTITVSVFADQVSATDGLSMQQSVNGTNWDHLDTYTIPASTGKTFHADRGAQFFRLVYTNGGVAQTVFRIQTLYDVTAPMGSSVRPSDARSLQNDMRENVSYMGLYNGTTLDLARGTIANGMLVDVSRIVGALPTGANTIGAVTITGTGGVTATKASATPAATTDISQVVALSPNSPAFIKSADL